MESLSPSDDEKDESYSLSSSTAFVRDLSSTRSVFSSYDSELMIDYMPLLISVPAITQHSKSLSIPCSFPLSRIKNLNALLNLVKSKEQRNYANLENTRQKEKKAFSLKSSLKPNLHPTLNTTKRRKLKINRGS